jgi:type II secretory pathway pseudopilin PulG
MRASHDTARERLGFTLLDALLVVVILTIVAMAAVPIASSLLADSRLGAAAAETVSALQFAGNLAIRYQRTFGVEGSVNLNSLTVFDNRYRADAASHPGAAPPVAAWGVVLNPLDRTWYTLDLDDAPSCRGATLSAVPAGGIVRFYPDGHTGESDSVFVLRYGSATRSVRVSGVTGRVTAE